MERCRRKSFSLWIFLVPVFAVAFVYFSYVDIQPKLKKFSNNSYFSSPPIPDFQKNNIESLHYVVDVARAKSLIDKGVDVNAVNWMNNTPLCTAAISGNIEIASFLIENGADVNKRSPLGIAALYGNKDMAEFLLENGALVNGRYETGITPLHMAGWSFRNSVDIAKILLDNGADISAIDDDGNTPLHAAANEGDPKVINLFIEHGADIHARNNNGETPLHIAAWMGHGAIVELLLDLGADIAARTNNGQTALHVAIIAGPGEKDGHISQNERVRKREATFGIRKLEVVKILLDRGAEINIRENDGRTPLMIAGDEEREEIASFLLKRGAIITSPSR